MGAVITLANRKGGVAKTTSTYFIAHALDFLNKTVLVIDIDPQASLTVAAGLQPGELEEAGKTIASVFTNEVEMRDIVNEEGGVLPAVVPSGPELDTVELAGREESDLELLKESIATVRDDYDFVLVDSPPNFGYLYLCGLMAADGVLIPSKTDLISVAGIEALLGSISSLQLEGNPRLEVVGCIPTNHTKRNKLDQQGLSYLKSSFKGVAKVFGPIPHSTVFERCLLEGTSVQFKGVSAKGRPYLNVAKELIKIYG